MVMRPGGGIGGRRVDQGYRPPAGWAAQASRSSQISVPSPSDVPLQPQVSALVIAAGGQQPYRKLAISTPSYLVSVDGFNAAPTVPFYSLAMQWKDPITNTILQEEKWILLATNVAPAMSNTLIGGRGPAKAARLDVVITNFDGANPITVDFSVYQSSRTIARDDWRSISNNISGTYTYGGLTFDTPVSEPTGLLLGCSPSIPLTLAQPTQSRVNALWAGQALLGMTITGTSPTGLVTVYAVDPDFGTPLQPLYQWPITSTVFAPQTMALPRTPSIIEFQNTGTNNMTISYALIGQEFAS